MTCRVQLNCDSYIYFSFSEKGGWSEWSEWTVCSAICGEGRKTRLRMCADPYPSGGGGCLGPEVDTSDCNRSQRARQSK